MWFRWSITGELKEKGGRPGPQEQGAGLWVKAWELKEVGARGRARRLGWHGNGQAPWSGEEGIERRQREIGSTGRFRSTGAQKYQINHPVEEELSNTSIFTSLL